VGQRHHRVDDVRVVGVVAHGAHERAVDLEHVEREAMQVAERRIARPEVIHVDLDLEGLELPEHLGDRVGILHDHALGDLQREPRSIHAVIPQYLLHVLDESRLGDLALRDVDAHREPVVSQAQILPGPKLPACLVEHPAAQLDDQPGVLGMGDEVHGVNRAPVGMVPAGQHLEAGEAAGSQRDDRLVEDVELVRLNRPFQIGVQLQP
jgi:hypothetical protein